MEGFPKHRNRKNPKYHHRKNPKYRNSMDMNIKREQKYFLAISNTQYHLRQMAKIKEQD